MIGELFANMTHSTPAGYVGVIGIFVYFCLIVGTAAYRIRKAEHMHH